MKYQKKKFYAGIQILIIKNIINLWKMWEDVYIIVAVWKIYIYVEYRKLV